MTQQIGTEVIALILLGLGGMGLVIKAWFDVQAKKLEDRRLADVDRNKVENEKARAEIEERLSIIEADRQNRESWHEMIGVMKSMLEQHGKSLEQNERMVEQIGKNTMAIGENTESVDKTADAVGQLIEQTQRMQADMQAVLSGLNGIGQRLDDANLPELKNKVGSLVGEIEDVVKRHLADVQEVQDAKQMGTGGGDDVGVGVSANGSAGAK